MTDKFTGLDLVDRVPEELRMKVHNILQQVVSKTISKKKMQEGKVVVWGGLTNNWNRREVKGKGERERYTQMNAEFQREIRKS